MNNRTSHNCLFLKKYRLRTGQNTLNKAYQEITRLLHTIQLVASLNYAF